MNMLRAHNTKTASVINGFNKYQHLRQRSKDEGIPFEQLLQEQGDAQGPAAKKKGKKGVLKKKAVNNMPEFELVVKDKDGKIQNVAADADPVVVEEPASAA